VTAQATAPGPHRAAAAMVAMLPKQVCHDGSGRVRENAEPGSTGYQRAEQLQSFRRELGL
jgi:hypothetical protein